ncbi:MAG: hypothetical protein ACPG5W_02910 [Flavobacteriales bacterium]
MCLGVAKAEKEQKQRTIQQNKAMHKYFSLLAEALNDSGKDMKKVLKPGVDIPWTTESVKNHLWRPIMGIMQGVESTTEQSTKDPQEIYEVLNRHIAQNHGVQVDWPSNEPPMIEER